MHKGDNFGQCVYTRAVDQYKFSPDGEQADEVVSQDEERGKKAHKTGFADTFYASDHDTNQVFVPL